VRIDNFREELALGFLVFGKGTRGRGTVLERRRSGWQFDDRDLEMTEENPSVGVGAGPLLCECRWIELVLLAAEAGHDELLVTGSGSAARSVAGASAITQSTLSLAAKTSAKFAPAEPPYTHNGPLAFLRSVRYQYSMSS